MTIFIGNVEVRNCAPLSLMLLSHRMSVISVCIKRNEDDYENDNELIIGTEFVRNISDRCFVPVVPI
jgi:hypothetical protein